MNHQAAFRLPGERRGKDHLGKGGANRQGLRRSIRRPFGGTEASRRMLCGFDQAPINDAAQTRRFALPLWRAALPALMERERPGDGGVDNEVPPEDPG